MWFFYRALTYSFFFCSLTVANADMYRAIKMQEIFQQGKDSYQKHCIGCHGENGDGNGIAARFLQPKPRDFTKGIFKFRSTALEKMPLDEDLIRTISQGVLGTSMPDFALLSSAEKYALAQYVKSFYTDWNKEEKQGAAVVGAIFPRNEFVQYPAFMTRAEKGKKIFQEACMVCHGHLGKGDGPGSVDLTDDWGQPILPADLSKKFIKSGRTVGDIYRVLLTGIGGTPMPSFKDTYPDDELWDVAAYVLYLRGHAQKMYGDVGPISPIAPEE